MIIKEEHELDMEEMENLIIGETFEMRSWRDCDKILMRQQKKEQGMKEQWSSTSFEFWKVEYTSIREIIKVLDAECS